MYLINLVGNNDVTIAMNCNLSNYFSQTPNIKYKYVRYLERSSANWDYALFGVNYIHPYQLKNNTWQSADIIKTFYQQKKPVAVLLKRRTKNDYKGIVEVDNGNYKQADKLLKEAVKDNPYNVWLFVYLAKICFGENDFSAFEKYLKEGLELHPFYEPFYLLKAQKQFNDGEYSESMETLQQLMQINPRYTNATRLLRAVKEKL